MGEGGFGLNNKMLLSIFEYLKASCNNNLLKKIFPKTVNDALCCGKDAQQFVIERTALCFSSLKFVSKNH